MAWLVHCIIGQPIKACWLLDVPAAIIIENNHIFSCKVCSCVLYGSRSKQLLLT